MNSVDKDQISTHREDENISSVKEKEPTLFQVKTIKINDHPR